jgi:hypothetical protein
MGEDEQEIAREFRARFLHVPMVMLAPYWDYPVMELPSIKTDALDGSYKPVGLHRPSKSEITRTVLKQFREINRRPIKKQGDQEYDVSLSEGHSSVVVSLDFGGWDQLRVDFSIIIGSAGTNVLQHLPLGDIFGFGDLPTDELTKENLSEQVAVLTHTICSLQDDLLNLATDAETI